MKRPKEMSPMKAMMGMTKSSSPKLSTLKRARGIMQKSKISMPTSSSFRLRTTKPLMPKVAPISAPKALPDFRLKTPDFKLKTPDMRTAHTTPALPKGVAAPAPAPVPQKRSRVVVKKGSSKK
jgi:hypothetical protein